MAFFPPPTGCLLSLNGFQISATGTASDYVNGGFGLMVANGGYIVCDNLCLDSCDYAQMQNYGYGSVISAASATANIRFSGTSFLGWNVGPAGLISFADCHINWNSPTYTGQFANAGNGGVIQSWGLTKTGSFTGKRFWLGPGGIIIVGGGGVNYFPGTIDGSASILSGTNFAGGFYV